MVPEKELSVSSPVERDKAAAPENTVTDFSVEKRVDWYTKKRVDFNRPQGYTGYNGHVAIGCSMNSLWHGWHRAVCRKMGGKYYILLQQ